MKNIRAIVMIVASVAIGLVAVVVAANWVTQQANVATSKVVVATRDIDLGTPLTAEMLSVTDWPSKSVPPNTVSDLAKLDGRVTRVAIQAGEAILESKLAPPGAKGGLSAVIEPGKRAVTVKVNEVIGVAGFALPGNFVDVLVYTEDEQKRPISKIVLERVLVLAIAQETEQKDPTKPKVVNAVTLELTPEQTERLDLARSIGTLSLVLRSQLDKQPVLTAGARKEDLLLMSPAPPPTTTTGVAPAPAPAPRRSATIKRAPEKDSVEVIKGVQKSKANF
jgi:pilus assembly protein CpaB